MVPELTVVDLEQSIDFYRSLGFSVRFRRAEPPFAYLELGEAQLMLEEIHEGAWATGALEPPFGRGVSFQIEVENAASAENLASEAGIPFFKGLTETWYEVGLGQEEGQVEFLVQDPDGYLLRFMEPLGERSIEA